MMRALAVAAAAVLIATSAAAQPLALAGWDTYCGRTGDCAPVRAGGRILPTALLARVNRDVNAAMTYTDDLLRLVSMDIATADHWQDALRDGDGYGDCEDYALAKRNRLVSLGWSRRDLSLAACRRHRLWHVVLTASTPTGRVVLDNLELDVYPLRLMQCDELLIEDPDARPWRRQ